MVNVKVVFPDMLVRSLNIEKEINLEGVETILDVYKKLSQLNVHFKERMFKDEKINRFIGIIIEDNLIIPDNYNDILFEKSEIRFQMPVAGG